MKNLRIGLTIILSLMAAPIMANDSKTAEFSDGLTAFIKGDHASALRVWAPLAKQGNRDAQYHMAHMYQTGTGVKQDEMKAFRWYSLAASKGHTTASYKVKHWNIEKQKVAHSTY